MDYDDEPEDGEEPVSPCLVLGIAEDTIQARLESYYISVAEPREKLAAIIDCFCRRNFPDYVCEEGLVKTIFKSIFSQKYRDSVLTRFYDQERILPHFLFFNLDKSGIMDDLYTSGSSFEDVIETLRQSEGYVNNKKEEEKLNRLLNTYDLMQKAGWTSRRIKKIIENM